MTNASHGAGSAKAGFAEGKLRLLPVALPRQPEWNARVARWAAAA